jgi:TRAP-type C4-dicarboxylate transport system substrate-binding protein
MRKALIALAAVGAIATASGPAAADGEVVVRVGTAAPEDTPWHKQLLQLKKRVEAESADPARSEKPIKMKLFMGSVKGGEDAMARQVAQGALECAGLSTGALAIIVPELEVLDLPYRFRSLEEADKVLDDPEVWALVVKLLNKKGLEPFIWSENGFRNFASKKAAIKTPADVKGMKMRAQEARVHIETWKAMGASPVPISVPETLSALQTGVVDGFDNTPLFAFAASWYQGVKHWTVSDHMYQPALLVYNKAWLDKLTPKQRELLFANRLDEQKRGRAMIRKLNEPLLKNLAESGITITRLSDAEKAEFAKVTAPVYQKIRALQSPDGKALFDLIEKKVGRK